MWLKKCLAKDLIRARFTQKLLRRLNFREAHIKSIQHVLQSRQSLTLYFPPLLFLGHSSVFGYKS
jgi:hypothetical protein